MRKVRLHKAMVPYFRLTLPYRCCSSFHTFMRDLSRSQLSHPAILRSSLAELWSAGARQSCSTIQRVTICLNQWVHRPKACLPSGQLPTPARHLRCRDPPSFATDHLLLG